jgi:hypothetical protein
VSLKHVYALVDLNNSNAEIGEFYVVLSNDPIDEFQLSQENFSQAGLTAIKLSFDAEGQLRSQEVRTDSMSSSGGSSAYRFVPRHFEPGRLISGTISPRSDDAMAKMADFDHSATFSAAIVLRPQPVLAALDSPPALAAGAFLRVLGTKHKDAVKKILTPGDATALDGPNGAQPLARIMVLPRLLGPKPEVTRVVMNGEERAMVDFKSKNRLNDTLTLQVARLNGEWLLVL